VISGSAKFISDQINERLFELDVIGCMVSFGTGFDRPTKGSALFGNHVQGFVCVKAHKTFIGLDLPKFCH
jgi:hypothetical protein